MSKLRPIIDALRRRVRTVGMFAVDWPAPGDPFSDTWIIGPQPLGTDDVTQGNVEW